jgi:SnoaL-like domain
VRPVTADDDVRGHRRHAEPLRTIGCVGSNRTGSDRTEEIPMTDANAVVQQYLDAWNETDPDRCAARVAQLWRTDGAYVDPMVSATGAAQIAATIGAVQQQFPGWTFRAAGPIEAHHDRIRFRWELGPSGADAPIAGSDVVDVDADGRLGTVVGFLDRVPATAA